MAKPTLLDKALSIPVDKRNNKITDEEMELGIAWLQDTVTLTQVARVIPGGVKGSTKAYVHLALWLREAYRIGLLKVVRK